ncbi:carbohydrate sulfotransferase 3-like [Saccoglossus kowalevskii]|uniref:Carbohydrate sulfotransferase 3-like n=1 Tax=Saccoglossus kowalevskii TaxID=10224 RepID=A0ABM0MTG0_SACKO|nr:PREDICTED: carbohydrate sulfotransferase 3-like [Saccoglossus kowalevskii]
MGRRLKLWLAVIILVSILIKSVMWYLDWSSSSSKDTTVTISENIPGILEPQNNMISVLNQNKSIHVLINARMRTGSTLTGRYFSNHPDIMYLYEPELTLRYSLHYDVFNDSAANVEKLQKPFYDIIEGFFDCNYTRRPELLPFTNKTKWMKFSNGLAHLKGPQFNAKQITKLCETKAHRAVKTVRINDISKGLETLKKYDVKVIQIVRDPRGMINSRIKYEHLDTRQKQGKSAQKISEASKNYCTWLKTNIDAVFNGSAWLKEHYMIVRYEDLSERPRQVVPQMYDFIGLSNTKESDTILSSQKIIRGNAIKWRYSLPFNQTRIVQNNCPDDIFETLGYVKVNE